MAGRLASYLRRFVTDVTDGVRRRRWLFLGAWLVLAAIAVHDLASFLFRALIGARP